MLNVYGDVYVVGGHGTVTVTGAAGSAIALSGAVAAVTGEAGDPIVLSTDGVDGDGDTAAPPSSPPLRKRSAGEEDEERDSRRTAARKGKQPRVDSPEATCSTLASEAASWHAISCDHDRQGPWDREPLFKRTGDGFHSAPACAHHQEMAGRARLGLDV